MKKIFLASFLAVFLFSCTKKEVSVPVTNTSTPPATYTISDYSKLSIGNYWVYETVNVDTLGNITPTGTDSCYIKGDTVVNGNTYAHVINFPFNPDMLLRDSSSCMIDQNGLILFTLGYFNTALVKDTTPYITTIYSVPNAPVKIMVPMGNYNCYDYMGVTTIYLPGYRYGHTRYTDNYYSPGIGLVEASTFSISQPGTMQCRLIRVHVM